MADIKFKTKNEVDINKKCRVWFTCHPDDFDKYFREVCDDILETHDCAIYYTDDMTEVIAEEDYETILGQNRLFVIPVTDKLLTTPSRTMDVDLPYAMKEHISVLPIMMDPKLDQIYSKPDKFGELQYLNPYSCDITEISYKDKLKKHLDATLISEEMAERIRKAFIAQIFLSYRKKDRNHANKLMRLIHSIPECQDISVWFDEFLTPGESFKENIDKILDDCQLFTLLVTPKIFEKIVDENGKEQDNYVISTELPAAFKNKEKRGTDIFAVEMEDTDKEALLAINILDYVNSNDEAFRSRLLDAVCKIAITPNTTPEHKFLIGLAYLEGIDVEVDRIRAVKLITEAAETDFTESMLKLIQMYTDGVGVPKDHKEALKWSEKLSDYYFKKVFSTEGTIESTKALYELFTNYKDSYWAETIKFFLINVDRHLSIGKIEDLYKILMSIGISDYTLFFDASKSFTQHQEETQTLLITYILIKSVDGTYPPYSLLFWYVPEYELYAVLLSALDSLQNHSDFTKMLALTRDVCWIFGHYNTIDEITTSVSGNALYSIAKSNLTGVRNALCELFYTGETAYADGDDIYPRCFNIAEAKSWKENGYGVSGQMKTPFSDELGLYNPIMADCVDGELVGIFAAYFEEQRIESFFKAHSHNKLRGLILSPYEGVEYGLEINTRNIRSLYIPETHSSTPFLPFKQTLLDIHIALTDNGLIYFRDKVTIPEGVISIGNEAFEDCSQLTAVTFPSTLKQIGKNVFKNCVNLQYINNCPMGYTHEYLGVTDDCQINYCPNGLRHIEIPQGQKDISEREFMNQVDIVSVSLPDSIKTIGALAFSECESLVSLNIPNGLKSINFAAFKDCSSLVTINIPDSVEMLDMSVFEGCSSLISVTLPKHLTEIEYRLFMGCCSLTSITIPDSVTKIAKSAFKGCTRLNAIYNCPIGYTHEHLGVTEDCKIHYRSVILKNIEIPQGQRYIHEQEFANQDDIGSVFIPNGVKVIQEEAFRHCASLLSVALPDSLTTIENLAFADCSALTSIAIPDSVIKIGRHAFNGCTSLTSICNCPIGYTHEYLGVTADCKINYRIIEFKNIKILPGQVRIPEQKFANRADIVSVTLPEEVETIGAAAFQNCLSLESIVLPDNMKSIFANAFENCKSLTSITIPNGLKEIEYRLFMNCRSLTSIELPDSIKEIGQQAFSGCLSLTAIAIPKGLKSISLAAFEECSSLASITLPDSVKQLDTTVFEGCSSLASVTLPNNLAEIKFGLFKNCYSLTTVKFPDNLNVIEEQAFSGCRSLASIDLPDNLYYIEKEAFSGCVALKYITIPLSVREIDSSAFKGCTGLKEITISHLFEGQVAELFKDCNFSELKINFYK